MPSKDFKNQLWNSLSPELHIIYGPVCIVQYSVQCVYCTVYSDIVYFRLNINKESTYCSPPGR